MTNNNILILSANAKKLLVDAFKTALAPYGGEVFVADISMERLLMQCEKNYVILPLLSGNNFIDALREACLRHDIRLVIPTNDKELPILAQYKQDFSNIGVEILVPSSQTANLCADKLKFAQFCQENSFLTPQIYMRDDINERDNYFIRARHGDWKEHFKASNRDSCLAILDWLAMENYSDAIITQYHNLSEFSIDVLSDCHGNALQAVVRKRKATFGGESWRSQIYHAPQAQQDALDLANKLGFVGHNTIQCFLDDDAKSGTGDFKYARAMFFEANPRFGGAANVSIQAGLDSPRRITAMVFGNEQQQKAALIPHEINYHFQSYRYSCDFIKTHDHG